MTKPDRTWAFNASIARDSALRLTMGCRILLIGYFIAQSPIVDNLGLMQEKESVKPPVYPEDAPEHHQRLDGPVRSDRKSAARFHRIRTGNRPSTMLRMTPASYDGRNSKSA